MSFTLSALFSQMAAYPSLIVIIVLVILVAIVSGATDAPNTIAAAVSTRCLTPGQALAIVTIFTFVGLIGMSFISSAVANTMFSMVDFTGNAKSALVCLEAAMIAAIVWGTACWVLGIPASKSHSLIAGLTGGAVALNGWSAIIWSEWVKVIYGMVFSLAAGFTMGWVFSKAIAKLAKFAERRRANKICNAIEIVCSCLLACLYGSQDGQKFISIALLGMGLSFGNADLANTAFPMWLMIVTATCMSLGVIIGGKRIIKSVAMDMIKLEKYQAVAANVPTAIMLLTANLTGMPVSTSHCCTTSIMGVGAAKNPRHVKWNIAGNMALAWVVTFPLCGVFGFLMAKLFLLF